MSYHDNGFCCLKVETGALIFSICNTIFTSLWCLLSFIALYFSLIEVSNNLEDERSERIFFAILVSGVLIMSVAFSILAIVFSIILAKGILKRKAGYVKAYFLYGVVVAALSLSAALAASFLSLHPTPVFYQEFPHVPIILAVIGVTLLYGLVLIMIRFTYKKFEREPKLDCSYVQKLLEEKY
ncbi:uncharacterized protein LOC126373380 isoform X1 [Pectinophora gossypiella]|uniref:uncharacterized protein LOC126373380 isoform X1 n=1 Tax=Pectinophora gossypiella TaxID=13191 RepID=UPI00214EFED5|nr:uncharacterized protein LOC126373380 isoform X1 [Pectinophora gossypiella]